MHHFLNSLLIGLTTVFAWTPASILLLLALFGIYTGIIYLDDVGLVRMVSLSLIGIGAVAGHLGLTSICWGLKLNPKTRLFCLTSGAIALTSVIVIGYLSENELLHISFDIEQIYLFVCPLFLLLLHVVLEYRRIIR
jgi:hypothetical protein